MTLNYYIKFDGHPPFMIRAKDFLELIDLIKYQVEKYRKPFEWLNREY